MSSKRVPEVELVTTEMLMAGFGHSRDKDSEESILLAEIGEPDKGNGVRMSLHDHYLLLDVQRDDDDSGEFWIPITTLLEMIGRVHERVAN